MICSTRSGFRIAMIQRFLPSRSRGGVGHFTHGLSNALVHRGHSVTVFSEDPAPAGAAYEVREVVAGNGSQRRSGPLAFPFRVARQDFSAFDLVHAQGDDQLIPRRRGLPVVRTMHGSSWAEAVSNGWRMRSLKRFLAHSYFYLCEFAASLRADQTVAVSHDTCRYYLNVSHVIPNGVAVDRFADCGEARSLHPTILFVGDLDSRKRGRMLLDVFSNQVRPLLPDCELWLVCPERVHAPGVVCHSAVADERLAALYRLAWVFCLPSSYEGFGRPYVEAMAAGAAVVATPNPGAREVLADGLYGMIASPDQLANALHAMLSDTERRKDYVHRGRDRAQSYAWEQVAQQYEQVYESVRMPRA